jgi:hypothetical protein
MVSQASSGERLLLARTMAWPGKQLRGHNGAPLPWPGHGQYGRKRKTQRSPRQVRSRYIGSGQRPECTAASDILLLASIHH